MAAGGGSAGRVGGVVSIPSSSAASFGVVRRECLGRPAVGDEPAVEPGVGELVEDDAVGGRVGDLDRALGRVEQAREAAGRAQQRLVDGERSLDRPRDADLPLEHGQGARDQARRRGRATPHRRATPAGAPSRCRRRAGPRDSSRHTRSVGRRTTSATKSRGFASAPLDHSSWPASAGVRPVQRATPDGHAVAGREPHRHARAGRVGRRARPTPRRTRSTARFAPRAQVSRRCRECRT